MRPRASAGTVTVVGVLAGIACLLLALLAAAASWPRLLVPLLRLEREGSLAAELPPDSAPLTLDGAPPARFGQLEFSLPPFVPDQATLAAEDLGGAAFAGEAAAPGVSNYLLTLDEAALNRFADQWLSRDDSGSGLYREVWIDLQPGSVILFADVNLGLRRQRAGLLLVQNGTGLRPARLVLDNASYALPENGLISGWADSVATNVERLLEALVVKGPLPGEARISEVRFHPDRVEILAQATYPVPHAPDTGWQPLEPGIELRQMDIAAQLGSERATIVRLDPSLVRFRVGYDPGSQQRLSTWATQSDALMAINGGFFTPENAAIGIVISDGQRWGTSLGGFAGMFAVTTAGEASVRWLTTWPYDPNEPLAEAVQSFPILVKPGGQMGFPAGSDEGLPDRRTVIAQDRMGRILVIVAPSGILSLHELATFLAESDLELDIALNLDGGASTGIWLSAGEREVNIDSFTPIPSVIWVDRR